LHLTPNSFSQQSITTYPAPTFGFIVQKGIPVIFTSIRVAALKKELLPLLGLPN
jgi:hypothetical protein